MAYKMQSICTRITHFLQFSKGPAYGKLNIIIQKLFLDTKSVIIKSEGGAFILTRSFCFWLPKLRMLKTKIECVALLSAPHSQQNNTYSV